MSYFIITLSDQVKLPALSPTMEHGTIVSWEKKEGDQVCEGLFEVSFNICLGVKDYQLINNNWLPSLFPLNKLNN